MRDAVRLVRGLCVLAGGALLLARNEHAPWAVIAALVLAIEPLLRAFLDTKGTALGAAVVWGLVALGVGLIAEGLALLQPLATGRPAAGHIGYIATLSALAALISVLNARTPGGAAWASLMALLILVFLIPWLEGPGLGRAGMGAGRLRLTNPWTIFYGLLVLAGVTNYLPTRYGPAVAWLGLGFALEFAGLTWSGLSASTRATLWTAVPWTFAAAVATAELRARSRPISSSRLEALWFWFRDHWGVVWALRTQERFNRTAEAANWPVRLAWHGVIVSDGATSPEAATATLKGLLRRFAQPDRIDRAIETSCQPTIGGR